MSSHPSSCCSTVIYVNDEKTSTRNNFTSYVCKALKELAEELQTEKGITIEHFNEDTVRRGVPRSLEIEEIIKRSSIAIVIISNLYATKDCLDQLMLILKEKRERQDEYPVLTVFYLVSPEDVGTQVAFAKKFADLRRKFSPQKVGEWSEALNEVATITGHNVTPTVSQAHIVDLLKKDVRKHVKCLEDKGIISATFSQKSRGIKASSESSKKPMVSFSPSVWGGKFSTERETAENECTENKNARRQTSLLRGPAFSNGDLANGRSGNSRYRSGVSMVASSSEQKPSEASDSSSLLIVQALISDQDLLLDLQKLGHLKDSLELLKGLTEADGIDTEDKPKLSYLGDYLAECLARRLDTAEGRTKLKLADHEYYEQLEKLGALSYELKTVGEDCRELENKRSIIKADLAAEAKIYELELQELSHLRASLELLAVEIHDGSHLGKQMSWVECTRRKKLG